MLCNTIAYKYSLATALCISCILHLIFISLFRITAWIPYDSTISSLPLFIAVDETILPASDSNVATDISFHRMQEGSEQQQHLFGPYSPYAVDTIDKKIIGLESIQYQQAPTPTPLPPFSPFSSSLEVETPSQQLIRIYPIKIRLEYGIQNLELIEDGSEFFLEAGESSLFLTSQFCHSKPRVQFFITLDEKSGKICSSSCVQELIDKRLQAVAIALLNCFCFQIDKETPAKFLSGMVEIQFHGDFETLSPYISWKKLVKKELKCI